MKRLLYLLVFFFLPAYCFSIPSNPLPENTGNLNDSFYLNNIFDTGETVILKKGKYETDTLQFGSVTDALKTLNKIADFQFQQRNYRESWATLYLVSQLKDSLFAKNKSEMLADMQSRFDISQKENEIELRKQEIMLRNRKNQIKQTQTIGLSILIFLILVIVLLLFLRHRNKIQNNKLIYNKQMEVHSARQALIESELKINEIEKSKLQNELLFKQNEIVNYALSVIQKNEFYNEIKTLLSNLLIADQPYKNVEINSIIRKLNQSINTKINTDDVQKNIDEVNHQFIYQLNQKFPNLTNNEKRLCGFLRIGLSNKDIATLNNTTPKAVEMARYRLRKKLDLSSKVDLTKYFKEL
jgi:DNA-binding CsgD family transcriptional regulator